MRIAYVFDRPLPARETDSEQALQTIAAFSRGGAEVTLVLPGEPGSISAGELRAHYQVEGDFEVVITPSAVTSWTTPRKWWHALRATRLPVVQAADVAYTRNFPTLFALARGHTAFAYETYRPWADQFPPLGPAFRAAMAAPGFAGAILHSRFACERYRALGVPAERLLIAHNGHDPARFRERPPRDALRAKLGLPTERPVVVYTGHINLTKGMDTVLALARRERRALFVLVGSEGRGVVEALSHRHENIRIVPWQPFATVAEYLISADVLLQPPSRIPLKWIGNTVLPMKLFLYLAAGRPILAPDLPDMRELLSHDHNALLVPAGDHGAAAAALARLIDDDALSRRLSAAALATAEGLTWDARARRVLGFLEQRLASARAASRVC